MIRLAIRCRPEQAELVLADLAALAPNGVEERRLDGEGGDGAGLVEYAIYGAEGELPDLGEVEAAIGGGLVNVSSSEIAGDWADRWREFHRPVRIGGEITVRPPWIEAEPGDGGIDIVIDPGQAFGTGAHATTRLCLEQMLELARTERDGPSGPFADLGAGSGVLAIAAAKLGWHPVRAYDNEAASVEAISVNAAANGVEIEAEGRDLRHGEPPTAPVIAANLTAPMLVELAGRLDPDRLPGTLICSGMLTEQADLVAKAFAAAGLVEERRTTCDSWSALRLIAS